MMKSELLFLIRARTQNAPRRQQLDVPARSADQDRAPIRKRATQPAGRVALSQRRRPLPQFQPVLLAGVFAFGGSGAVALDAQLPPGGNFNLSPWKLTLPDASATEIFPAALAAGYSNATYFYTGADGAMVCWSPVTGGTTSGSIYPRCELREMLVSTSDNVNWTTLGTHTLTAQCRVLQVPSGKKVIIGQIHAFGGNAQPLVKLQHDDGLVEALVKVSPYAEADTNYAFMTVALNALISYSLQVTNGWLTISVNGSNRTVNLLQNHPAWASQSFYFKAGSYCQDNVGLAQEGARVAFSELNVTHAGATHLASTGLDASRKLGFNLLAYDAGTYAIQASSNAVDWTDVFTSPAPGSFNFLETNPALAPRQFYRAHRLH